MKQLRWQIYFVLFLGLITVLFFSYLLPNKKQVVLMAEQELLSLNSKQPTPLETNNSFVDTFYSQLPTSGQLKEMQAFFFAQAVVKRLVIDTVNYELIEQPDISFSVYKMQMPVAGTYLEVMGFIRKMLETYPTVALTSVYFTREDVQNNQIEGDIEFSVYIKKDT